MLDLIAALSSIPYAVALAKALTSVTWVALAYRSLHAALPQHRWYCCWLRLPCG